MTIVLTRALGPDEFGLYALALAIALVVGLLADLGLGASLARFAAEARTRGEPIGDLLILGLRLKVVANAVVFGALFALAGPIESLFDVEGLATVVRIASVVGFFRDMAATLMRTFEALRRGGATLGMALARAGVELTLVLIFVAAGFGAAAALIALALGWAAGVLIGLALLVPVLLHRGRRSTSGEGAQATGPRHQGPGQGGIIRYGLHVWVAGLAWAGFERADQLLLGAFEGVEAVAIYEAAWRIAAVTALFGVAVGSAVGPRLAVRKDRAGGGELLFTALRFGFALYLPFAAIIAVIGPTLAAGLLGEDFKESGEVLRLLAPYIALLGTAPVLSLAVDYVGDGGLRKYIALAALLINVALDLILIPPLGVLGPAIATSVAVVVYVGGLLRIVSRSIHLDHRGLARSAGVALAAAGGGAVGAAAILWAWQDAGLVASIVAGVAGTLISGAILALARELPLAAVRALISPR